MAVLLVRLFQPSDVGEVFGPANGEFVFQQFITTDDRNGYSVDLLLNAILPSFVEFHAVDRSENVDPVRLDSNLIDIVESREIFNLQISSGRTELFESRPNAIRVFPGWSNPDIKVSRCAGMAVRCHRMSANDQVFTPRVV